MIMELQYSDILKLSRNTNDNVDLIKRLIEVFTKTTTTELSIIKEFLKYSPNPDYAKLEPHFHKMKSGLSYIATDDFLEEYLAFYNDFVNKRYDVVKQKIPVIIEKLQGLVEELHYLDFTNA